MNSTYDHGLLRLRPVLAAIVIGLSFASCSGNGEPGGSENEPVDSITRKIDSVSDTIGRKIKDVNEGVKGGMEKIHHDSLQVEDSIKRKQTFQ